MGKRVLITGASGFVGANLTRRLLREGHETHLILRPAHQAWRLEEIAGEYRPHVLDLDDREAVCRAVQEVRPDWVFHLAAYGAYSNQLGIERMIAINLLGTIALLDACADAGVEALVQTGSSSEYGFKDHAAREDEALQPNSHYAITKAAATHYGQFTAAHRGFNAATVRLYSIYGPYEAPTRLIPKLVLYGLRGQLPPLASPTTARDFVYVDDAVEAMLRVAATRRGGAVYNICSGRRSSLAAVVEAAQRLMNIDAEPAWSGMVARMWDTDLWVGSPDRMAREVGWKAQVDFEAGLQRTIEWLRDNPRWRTFYDSQVFGLS